MSYTKPLSQIMCTHLHLVATREWSAVPASPLGCARTHAANFVVHIAFAWTVSLHHSSPSMSLGMLQVPFFDGESNQTHQLRWRVLNQPCHLVCLKHKTFIRRPQQGCFDADALECLQHASGWMLWHLLMWLWQSGRCFQPTTFWKRFFLPLVRLLNSRFLENLAIQYSRFSTFACCRTS